jgi:hypothetical protein
MLIPDARIGGASRAIIGRWEMCQPGFIVSQLGGKRRRPRERRQHQRVEVFLKNTDEVAEVESRARFFFVTSLKAYFYFFFFADNLLRAAAVGDPVRVNEAAFFTAFTSIIF